MEVRRFGKTGLPVSVVGLGTWQLGADWGDVPPEVAAAILDATIESGITMVDTADVYGQGRSEHLIGDFLARLSEARRSQVLVATKMGRDGPQDPDEFHLDNYRRWTDASRKRLGVEVLDLVQLHSPPDEVFGRQQVWDDLETLVTEGGVRAYGVSVETVTQALRVVDRPTLASVQVILNPFRLKPVEELLPACVHHDVAVLARVPLASGLLSGRFDRSTQFSQDDHRYYNRDGQSFDVGETFSGVPFDVGVDAASEFATLAPPGSTAAQSALRWVLAQHGVTCVIPGASTVEQLLDNAAAGDGTPLPSGFPEAVKELYDRRLRHLVHHRW